MNFKKVLTIAALTGFSASVATGQGTAPTIVQGDYISNVFGNSNFVKNPNAKLNTKDVTVSNATVARSTTTPLVATSEFTVAIGTANGTATWATRAFDAGMKNQNCEARFTYRGFQATSKVQIKQSTNVVAELVLTPATDPRIASINFPCGDLSAATTFVVTDTAILAGTNEIGGIYVGLATNMANVAQAEMYGGIEYSGGATNTWNITQTSYASDFAANGSNGTAFGKCTAPATAVPQLICNNMPSGEYQVVWPIYLEGGFSNNVSTCRVIEASTGAVAQEVSTASFNTGTAAYTGRPVVITGNVSFSSAGSRTFKLQCRSTAGNIVALRFADQNNAKTVIYRFPSSSELVVTPERQNTFAGIRATGSITNIVNTSSVWTKLTQASGTLTRTNFGKAKVESNNDYSITVENMPVGSYAITVTGQFHAEAASAGNSTPCIFGISDTVGGTMIAAAQNSGNGDSSLPTQASLANTFTGIYTNSSVANRTFFVQAYRIIGGGQCYGFASGDRPLTITIIPLDQPSNSALYVQGPVKAAETGASIPAGYQMEGVANANNYALTNGQLIRDLSTFVPGVRVTQITRTLTPGNYLVTVDISCNGMPSGGGLRVYMVADGTTFASSQNISPIAGGYVSNSVTRYLRVTNNMVYKIDAEAGGLISGTCGTVSTVLRLN